MRTLRTKKTQELYRERIAAGHLKNGCPLCKEPSIREFEYWRIIDNAFPYDAIAEKHHLLVAKEHVIEEEMPEGAVGELISLKNDLNDDYQYLLESLPKQKSITPHHHLHLLLTIDKDF